MPARLLAHRHAAVAVLFATAIVPLSMLVGLAIDFGLVLQARAQLDMAADTAALAAARTAADLYSNNQANYITNAQTAASQWWTAQTGNLLDAQSVVPSFVVRQSGRQFTATVSYSANVAEAMPRIFNWDSGKATISNTAQAVITANQFGTVDYFIDNTSSMMIAATATDATNLGNAITAWLAVPGNIAKVPNLGLTKIANCTFACHWDAASTGAAPLDYYGLSRTVAGAAGITLRYDVVQQATTTAIQQMTQLEVVPGQLNVGIYAFGGVHMAASTYMQTVYPETPIDQGGTGAGANAAIRALGTVVTPVTGDTANTNFGNAINLLAGTVANSGTGNVATSPARSVIFVTDGIEDDSPTQVIPTTEGPINPAVCNALKAKGITVYVLYTTYSDTAVNLPGTNIALQPYIDGTAANDLVPALTSCASSPQGFASANTPADIKAAMTQLLTQAVGSTTRLTN